MTNIEPAPAAVDGPVVAEPAPVAVVAPVDLPSPVVPAPVPAVVANTAPAWVKYAGKALLAVLAVAAAYLVSVLQTGQGLGDVTLVQWLTLGYLELGAFGITYAVPNGPRPGGPIA